MAWSRSAGARSQNADIGDTREIWFIGDGFLYKLATYKDQEAWLSEIMVPCTAEGGMPQRG